MKKLFLPALFLLAASHLFAQQLPLAPKDTFTIQSLEVPVAPGFLLLDAGPTAIDRPAAPKAFGFSLLNAIQDSRKGLPLNYAAEFTPYWYFKHKNLTSRKYLGFNDVTGKQNGFNQFKLASFSFALMSTDPETVTDPTNINVALGLRTTFFKLNSKDAMNSLQTADSILGIVIRNPKLDLLDPTDPQFAQKVQEIQLENNAMEMQAGQMIQNIMAAKPMFAIYGAGSTNWVYQQKDFSTNHLSRWGAWLNVCLSKSLKKGYDPNNPGYISFFGAARIIGDETVPDLNGGWVKSSFFDLGLKAELEFNKIAFSYEYMFRRDLESHVDNTFRSTGHFRYRISDDLALTGAFGKNFGPADNLVTLFGVQMGFDTGNESTSK